MALNLIPPIPPETRDLADRVATLRVRHFYVSPSQAQGRWEALYFPPGARAAMCIARYRADEETLVRYAEAFADTLARGDDWQRAVAVAAAAIKDAGARP